MLKDLRTWSTDKMIGIVSRVTANNMEIEAAKVDGVELSEEECEALRAGILAGLETARMINTGDCGTNLQVVVSRTYEEALRHYGKYLNDKEAGHGEE